MNTFPIGWVLRTSTTGFAVGCRISEVETPHFGTFVKAIVGETKVLGLIYDIRIQDDPAVRQLILAGNLDSEAILDQRQNRLVPLEISVIVVGYQQDRYYIQNLPPHPPISLDEMQACLDSEIIEFTAELDYFRLILKNRQIPSDELIIASLLQATSVRVAETRREFLLKAGRALSRLLANDLNRLEGILRQIRLAWRE